MVSKLFVFFINVSNKYINKVSNRISFIGFPDFDDQLRGLIPYINGQLCVLVKSKNDIPKWVSENNYQCYIRIEKKNSLLGIYLMLTSRVIYFTHGIFDGFKKIDENKQCLINLWHGMPIKNIGYLDGKNSVPDAHYLLSSSEFYVDILSKAFGINKDRVLVAGLPRNSIITANTNNDYLIDLSTEYKNFFIWLPTYRKSNLGDIRKDGDSSSILGSDVYDLNEINNFMIKNNSVLIIKPHPMAEYKNQSEFSNILVISEDWLSKKSLTLYELLSISSALITDFSSVAIDYAITKKPVIFTIPDFSDYSNNRGFTFDIIEEIDVASIANNQKDLIYCFTEVSKGIVNINSSHAFSNIKKFDYELLPIKKN